MPKPPRARDIVMTDDQEELICETCEGGHLSQENGSAIGNRIIPRTLRAPRKPTKSELEEHAATHCPYLPSCRHCVSGRGRNAPHRAVDKELREQEAEGVQRVLVDYFYMTEAERKSPRESNGGHA